MVRPRERVADRLPPAHSARVASESRKWGQGMAEEELLAILRQGPEVWNAWRQKNTDPEAEDVDLRGANLRGADLSWTSFDAVDMDRSDLSEANLRGANLRFGRLAGANLYKTSLIMANLFRSSLQGADLSMAICPERF